MHRPLSTPELCARFGAPFLFFPRHYISNLPDTLGSTMLTPPRRDGDDRRVTCTTIKRGVNFTLPTTLGEVDLLGEIVGGGSYNASFRTAASSPRSESSAAAWASTAASTSSRRRAGPWYRICRHEIYRHSRT